MHMRCTSDMTGLGEAGLKRLYADERGNAKRIVLLLILLLVLVAAAVFLLYPDLISPPAPEPVKPAAQSQVKRKVVQLPQKTAAQSAAEKPAESPAEKSAGETAAAQPAAVEGAGDDKAAETKPAPTPVEKSKAAAPTPTPEEKPKAAAAPAPKPASEPAPKPAAAVPAVSGPKGPYTVTAGAYLMSSSVKQADKSIRTLGFTPYHSKIKRDVEVTRLKEGTYGEAEARARVAQYKREFSDDAFTLKEGNGWTVYLGSYVGLDRARVHADRLYALGVRLTEVQAVVPMTLTLVRFGDFPDQAAAQKIVVKAKAAGLDAYVSKVK